MKKAVSLWSLGIGVFAALCFFAAPALATLGGTISSVESDRIMLSAAQGAVTALGSYTVYEMTSSTITLREYVSASGVVFALAWNGLVAPDVTALLGTYAGEYQVALSNTPRQPGARNRSVVSAAGVVVERWGHMRNMQGRAYAPDLIPPGVGLDEIR